MTKKKDLKIGLAKIQGEISYREQRKTTLEIQREILGDFRWSIAFSDEKDKGVKKVIGLAKDYLCKRMDEVETSLKNQEQILLNLKLQKENLELKLAAK